MQIPKGEAMSLHEEIAHSISSLLDSLARVSLDDLPRSMSALHAASEHLLLLKQDQRSLGILQGIQLSELLSQAQARTEQQMQELDCINYRSSHRDYCRSLCFTGSATTDLSTIARQELSQDEFTESDSDMDLINNYLKDDSSTHLLFDFTDPNNHLQNLKKLQLEITHRSDLVQQLDKLYERKQDVAHRLEYLQNSRQILKSHLDDIDKAMMPVKGFFLTPMEGEIQTE
jgi:thiamine phosphate synthase YjbQ (UPF0047 family)